jgi:predicted ABC-type ATPase
MPSQPQIVVIGGPNGAGKSTFARTLVAAIGIDEFVNPDTIARGISAIHPETAAIQSAQIMRTRIRRLAELKVDFAFETTLAARTYAAWIRGLQEDAWSFRLVFVTLESADLAVDRVRCRVANGGHNIPEEDIHRRFERAHTNFHQLYMPLADIWSVYDNSSPNAGPVSVAFGERKETTEVFDQSVWQAFCEKCNAKP